jgi:hypothetical protein
VQPAPPPEPPDWMGPAIAAVVQDLSAPVEPPAATPDPPPEREFEPDVDDAPWPVRGEDEEDTADELTRLLEQQR